MQVEVNIRYTPPGSKIDLMLSATQIRFKLGNLFRATLDAAVVSKSLPARFPIGMHLEYDLQRFLTAPVRQIIDGGANHGDTAVRFARFFKEATVHAFEPVRATCDRLELRSQRHPRIRCRCLALGDEDEEIKIRLNKNSELNSLLNNDVAKESAVSETIHVVTLDQYAQAQGMQCIDLLKLDLEGYELPALRGARKLFEKGMIQAVYAECGFGRADRYKTPFNEINELMLMHGFLFSGFYQTYRWGSTKRWAAFSNGLWLRV